VSRPLSENPAILRLQQRIRTVVEESPVALRVPWVRGHRPSAEGTAAFLNNWCDRAARKGRRPA